MKIYLFIGPQRSRTTSIYHFAKESNEISFHPEKEHNSFLKKDKPNYKSYTKQFAYRSEVAFDLCPQYANNSEARDFITKNQNWFEKIIYLYRDPFERAESIIKLQLSYGRNIDDIDKNEAFISSFVLHDEIKSWEQKIEKGKFIMWDVDSIENNLSTILNTKKKIALPHVHKAFGEPRFKLVNKIFLTPALKIFRGLGLNDMVDTLKESSIIRRILFHQKLRPENKLALNLIHKFENELIKEKDYFIHNYLNKII